MKNFTLSERALRLIPALLTVGLLATATPTFAQPAGGPGTNDNPPDANGGPGGGRGGNRPDMAAMQAQRITQSLKSAGYTDAGLIEAVTTYMTNRQAARKPLYDAANALSQALSDENTTAAQMDTLWSAFSAALDAEKTRTAGAEADLDKQIGYSKDSKLEAALTLLGVTGDASGYLNSGQGGRGGRGGGQGGMGGQGGRFGGGQGAGQGGPGGRGGRGGNGGDNN